MPRGRSKLGWRGTSASAAPARALRAAAIAALLSPWRAAAKISAVGFQNRFYRAPSYTGSRVLEHNQTDRFEEYVEATWTQSMTVDVQGRIWVVDRVFHQVIMMEARTRYVPWPAYYIEYAGRRGVPGHMDGSRQQAIFNGPMGIAVSVMSSTDPLVIYVADTNNHCVRRLTYADGRVSTVVGSAGSPGLRDGPGMESRFNAPMSLGLDLGSQRLFVLDNVRQIRYVNMVPTVPLVTTLVSGACRGVSRQVVVQSIIIRTVGCHPDWRALDAEGVEGLDLFKPKPMCRGHQATCKPRHHPALDDRHSYHQHVQPASVAAT